MLIANPMYDVVFKYLLSDNKIAKLLIGAIIGEDIVELDFKPTEYRTAIESRNLLVYRLDFSAKIRNTDGTFKLILIEVQKAQTPSDILRFRRYLGSQYADENNIISEKTAEYNALPIVTIYFLGHKLEHTNAPIIKVQREYLNMVTGETIEEKEPFIEALTYDSFIIQVPFLAEKRKTELEQILSVFDQSATIENHHFLNINEKDYPENYREVIRRLIKAASEPQVRKTMTVEDDVLGGFACLERQILDKVEEIKSKDNELQSKDSELQVKESELQVKESELKSKETELVTKDKAIEKAIALLVVTGLTESEARSKIEG